MIYFSNCYSIVPKMLVDSLFLLVAYNVLLNKVKCMQIEYLCRLLYCPIHF